MQLSGIVNWVVRRRSVWILCAMLLALNAGLAAAAEPAPEIHEPKAITVPNRKLPDPAERGKPYPLPATEWKEDPVLWGWTCELADGSGISFGGVHQTADDGNPHTQIKDASGWKPIVEDLRKANPLQPYFARVRALRNTCKDTLAIARNLYFEGKTSDEEAKLIKAGIDPAIEKLIKDLAAFAAELNGAAGLKAYETGQIKFALKHLDAAAAKVRPFGALTTPEQLANLHTAQIEMEIAGEAFDAEPPPRSFSKIAFEPKTKLFVIFGGEHMDYATNDLWVFDLAKRRWFQRHPEGAPPPRCDAHLDALGDGRVVMYGGCTTDRGIRHAGPARWIYDLERNVWTADGHQEPAVPADMRSRGWPPDAAEIAKSAGTRPNAAANEAILRAIPINTWVRLATPPGLSKDHSGISRDWGTWPYDPDRDLFYVWAGGHASYGGNDVARYHLATNRWEFTPGDFPLACCGTNEQYPSGVSFNLRPWVKRHVWNAQAYDPSLKKMVMGGANCQQLDPYFYLYDPDKADWSSRHHYPAHDVRDVAAGNDIGNLALRYTKHGMLENNRGAALLLDARTLEWKKLAVKGTLPRAGVDSSGMVYDPKRDRMLMVQVPNNGYARPYDGQIYALDMNTLQAAPLNPEGMLEGPKSSWELFLREAAYHPESDLFIWPDCLKMGNQRNPELFPAYDPVKNRWVTVKLAFPPGRDAQFNIGVNCSIHYDAKRGLLWVCDSSWNGGIWVLRFDASKAEIKPLKDYVPPVMDEKKK